MLKILKKLKISLSVTHIVVMVFLIDMVTGNWVKAFYDAPETMEEWQEQVILFNTAKSFFDVVPYLLLLIIANDLYDKLLIYVFLFFSCITIADWFLSSNWRPVGIDWIVLIISLFLIFTLKNARGNK